MKKYLLLILISFGFLLNSYGTHNLGGYISYKHVSNLTYEISVIIYADNSSLAIARKEIVISWGDGQMDSITTNNEILLKGNFLKRTFTETHVYPGSGSYKISIDDPNRGFIDNINNSVNVSFFIESILRIRPSSISSNNSIKLKAEPIYEIEIGKTFRQNLSIYDIDGDNLSFELVKTKGNGGLDAPGYFFPDSVSINRKNGEFKWKSPQMIGNFVFTIKVNECRNGISVATTFIDFPISVVSSLSNGKFQQTINWPTDSNNNYIMEINPTDSIELPIAYFDSISNTTDLNAFGDAFSGINKPSFSTDSIESNFIAKTFKWKLDDSNLRCAPYLITFRGSSENNQTFQTIENDITLSIFVRDQTMFGCDSSCSSILNSSLIQPFIKREVLVYPNPFKQKTKIKFSHKNFGSSFNFFLFDIFGKEVYSAPIINENEFIFYRNNQPAGIYFYKIEDHSNFSSSGKLIIID